MIYKDKVVLNDPVYYVPSYSGVDRVSILKLRDGDMALVQPHSTKKECKPFSIPLVHIFNTEKDANTGRRAWEQYRRKQKKATKEVR